MKARPWIDCDGRRLIGVSEPELSPLAADFLELARGVFLADRGSARGNNPDREKWHRHLVVELAMRQLEAWRQPAVAATLVELLVWLTDDDWTVRLVPHGPDDLRQLQLPLGGDEERQVALFSGGLDAVAGAAITGATTPLLAVAVETNNVMLGFQRRSAEALRAAGVDIELAPVPFKRAGAGEDDDATRRTRGLVFLAVGVAATLQRDSKRLLVFENGIGALNLPFTAAQWGAMTSRSVHPRTLGLVQRLVEELTGAPFAIENPFLTSTKGEMVAAVPETARRACSLSESCDNAAAGRGSLQRRCGYCTSCLLRRLSFAAAERSSWDDRPYWADVRPGGDRDRRGQMLWQAATFDRALQSSDPGALRREIPALRHVPVPALDDGATRRLLAAYVDEWRRYPDPLVELYLARGGSGRVAS